MFPQAELFTSIYDPEPWPAQITERPVHASFLNRLPGARAPLPEAAAADEPRVPLVRPVGLRPRALEQPRVRQERAHAAGRAARLLLPHADALRLGGGLHGGGGRRAAARALLLPPLLGMAAPPGPRGRGRRRRVRRELAPTSPSASGATTGATRRSCTRRSTSSTSSALPRAARTDYYLAFGRVVPYKRVDLAVAACARLGRRLKVAGDGRALDAVRTRAAGAEASSCSARSPRASATRCWAARGRCCSPARRTSGSCRSRRRRPARR